MRRIAALIGLLAAATLAGCSGGGSSSAPAVVAVPSGTTGSPTATATSTPAPAVLTNVAAVTFDAGPAALAVGSKGYTAFNQPFVTVTLCAPGSASNCQTIDHIILDTGSVGLRVIQSALTPSLLAALPTATASTGNPVGECYQYVNSYVFGSVRSADFAIAGERVAAMPFQVIGDTGRFATVPSGCSSGGGSGVVTVQDFGANGVIGIGSTATDCGTFCAGAGGSAAAIYYDCPVGGCGSIIARAPNETAPFEQLPNPVAAFATNNNGTIITLPAVPQRGVATLTGTVTFGIGTQTNNLLSATSIVPLTTSTSRLGPGLLTATYNGKTLPQSFIDSGSTHYFFLDAAITACTRTNFTAFYCPASPLLLSPTVTGTSGASASAAFTLYSPLDVAGSSSAAPGLGVNPTLVTPPLASSNSFDFGAPFYFGRSVYTAIEGRTAGGRPGPFVAF
ncbi:DUF3443 family protein [Sphingomonas sp. RB3P16]|uniref:DUF3443 family protein n=1 Tax=Parasphingomonas frigoris TaxID=3096163 RepID=UPI002FC9C3A9